MPEMQKMIGDRYRTTVICVDSYEDRVPRGKLFNPALEKGKPFESLMQFLLEMEDLLNEMQFPQPFMVTRRFSAQNSGVPPAHPEEGPLAGKLATFAVKVIFRQNASWQGCVTWLEGGEEESFRSALELLFLMDSAMSDRAQDGKTQVYSQENMCKKTQGEEEKSLKRQTGGKPRDAKHGG